MSPKSEGKTRETKAVVGKSVQRRTKLRTTTI